MPLDIGRVTHLQDLMHRAEASNGTAITSNWVVSTDGSKAVTWRPESASALSYASNSNDVASANAPGASSLVSRADHVHRGVRTVTSNTSNSLFGDVNVAAGTGIAIAVSGQTVTLTNTGVPGPAGGSVSYASNSNDVSYADAPGASTLVSRADHVHLGVTSLAHSSNTYTGPVTLETEGSLYIVRSAANTYRLGASGGSGGGGSSDAILGQTGIGGARIPGLQGSPDIRVAGTNDDEFDATLSGWTTLGALDTLNANTDFKSRLHIAKTTSGVQLDGIYKASPTIPFTVTMKVDDRLQIASRQVGIILAEAAPGKLYSFGTAYDVVWDSGVWTNRTTRASFSSGAAVNYNATRYLRIVVTSSTSVSIQFSRSGYLWTTGGSAINPLGGSTVGAVGIYVTAFAANPSEGVIDWIRFS